MKKESYFLKNYTNEKNINEQNEFEGDIVFARFINYMQIALLHKKLDFIKHQKFICQKEQNISDKEWINLSDRDKFVYSFFNEKDSTNFDKSFELNIAIDKLTEKQKQVIKLYYYKRKPLKIIAKEMNMQENAVKQLKLRAIIKLKNYLEEKDDE